ncbi:MAG: hypothetical protein JST39_01100 [Bacteroidetes bacterium]|nr:hypothetical protein [Bacteroidota bacterium]
MPDSMHLLHGIRFWEWFSTHHDAYLQIDDKDDEEIDVLLNDLLLHLHAYCDRLYFKIGGPDPGYKEFIITAEGNPEFFDKAEDLVRLAPRLKGWKIIALSPPADEMEETTHFDGIELHMDKIWFVPLDSKEEPHKFGIRVFLENYEEAEDEKFFYAVNYLLEKLLGEKDNALVIQYMEVSNLPATAGEGELFRLEDLPSYIDFWKTQVELN